MILVTCDLTISESITQTAQAERILYRDNCLLSQHNLHVWYDDIYIFKEWIFCSWFSVELWNFTK